MAVAKNTKLDMFVTAFLLYFLSFYFNYYTTDGTQQMRLDKQHCRTSQIKKTRHDS